jgi:hypothetical protein
VTFQQNVATTTQITSIATIAVSWLREFTTVIERLYVCPPDELSQQKFPNSNQRLARVQTFGSVRQQSMDFGSSMPQLFDDDDNK